jgi:hypothetical protein
MLMHLGQPAAVRVPDHVRALVGLFIPVGLFLSVGLFLPVAEVLECVADAPGCVAYPRFLIHDCTAIRYLFCRFTVYSFGLYSVLPSFCLHTSW